MQRIFKRAVIMIPTFFGITLVTFFLIKLTPGDPSLIRIHEYSGKISAESAERILVESRQQFGLDKPIFVQYKTWVANLLRLDLGRSYRTNEDVSAMIFSALPVTIVLNLLALIIIYAFSLPIGAISAFRQKGFVDRFSLGTFLVLYSLPNFWVAGILLTFLGGADYLNILPVSGLFSPDADKLSWAGQFFNALWHLILPAVCLSYAGFAFVSRFTRTSFLGIFSSDFIRTAYAKGCTNFSVIFRHAFRNASIPLVTMLGGILPGMISGSVIIEKIFSLPGMGSLMFTAVLARDYPLVMGIVVFIAVLTLFGLFLSDVLYAVVDPRIRKANS